MGQVISDESRAYFNAVKGNTNLMYWAPSINLARNQLWGRNQETLPFPPTHTLHARTRALLFFFWTSKRQGHCVA
jgi:beta-glucosidase-like glycosyl hydrolase